MRNKNSEKPSVESIEEQVEEPAEGTDKKIEELPEVDFENDKEINEDEILEKDTESLKEVRAELGGDVPEGFEDARAKLLEALFQGEKDWLEKETYFKGEKTTIQEVLEKNPQSFAAAKWNDKEPIWETYTHQQQPTEFYSPEMFSGVESISLIEEIKDTLRPEVMDDIRSIELASKKGSKGLRGESYSGSILDKHYIKLYEHDLSGYDEDDIDGKKYEVLVSAFHEIGHVIWRSAMLPSRLNAADSPKGLEGQIIGSQDREKWFKIFMKKRGDNKLMGFVEEHLFPEDKTGAYEFSDKLEEGWCHIFAQVALNPELLEKDKDLQDLMGKYVQDK